MLRCVVTLIICLLDSIGTVYIIHQQSAAISKECGRKCFHSCYCSVQGVCISLKYTILILTVQYVQFVTMQILFIKRNIWPRDSQINSNKEKRRKKVIQLPLQMRKLLYILARGFFLSWFVTQRNNYHFLQFSLSSPITKNITVPSTPWLSLILLSGSWCKWMWRGPQTPRRSWKSPPPPLVSWPSGRGKSWHWCGGQWFH